MPLDSRNHVLLEHEPAFAACFGEIQAFLAGLEPPAQRSPAFARLTPGEQALLELLARGLDNLQIAAHLGLTEKTVRNKVSAVFDKLEAPRAPRPSCGRARPASARRRGRSDTGSGRRSRPAAAPHARIGTSASCDKRPPALQ